MLLALPKVGLQEVSPASPVDPREHFQLLALRLPHLCPHMSSHKMHLDTHPPHNLCPYLIAPCRPSQCLMDKSLTMSSLLPIRTTGPACHPERSAAHQCPFPLFEV